MIYNDSMVSSSFTYSLLNNSTFGGWNARSLLFESLIEVRVGISVVIVLINDGSTHYYIEIKNRSNNTWIQQEYSLW